MHKYSSAVLAVLLLLTLPTREAAQYPFPRDTRQILTAQGISLTLVLVSVDPIALVKDSIVVLHLALSVGTGCVVHFAGIEPGIVVRVSVPHRHRGDWMGLFADADATATVFV